MAKFGSPLCDPAEPGQILVGADSHVRLERFFAFCKLIGRKVRMATLEKAAGGLRNCDIFDCAVNGRA